VVQGLSQFCLDALLFGQRGLQGRNEATLRIHYTGEQATVLPMRLMSRFPV
jgi:hypothetical protein